MIKHLHFSEEGTKDTTSERLEATRVGIWDNNDLFREKLTPVMQKEIKILEGKIER
jgi:hypothetical protein